MKDLRILITKLFLIIFILLSIGINFLHNHKDINFHNDCPACNWILIISSTALIGACVNKFLKFINFVIRIITANIKVYCLNFFFLYFYLRSPPIFQ